jgi:hypothetical protein
MISANARLTIQRIPLSQIIVVEYQERYPEKLLLYMKKLREYPDQYAGLLFVTPSNVYPKMYALLDGHHKFCASIMVGREDALCVVIEEPPCS